MATTVGRGRRTSLIQALVWFVLAYGLAIVGYGAANAIAGRWFGPDGYGLFVVVVTLSTAIGQLGLLGTHRGGLRSASILSTAPGDRDEALLQLRRDAAVASRLSLPLAGVAAASVMLITLDGDLRSRAAASVGFALQIIFSGQQKLCANYLRGLGHIRQASLLEGRSGGAVVSVAQALLLLLVWQSAPEAGLAAALMALVLGFVPPVLVARRTIARSWASVAGRKLRVLRSVPDTLRRNWRFAANQLAVYAAGTVEIWIAGAILAAHQASEFSAAQRLALLLAIPLTSIQVVFAPVAARLLASGEASRLQTVLRTGATLAFAGTSVLWIPMLLAPTTILGLMYGPGFEEAAIPLVLATIGNLANVLVGLPGTALVMSRHEGAVALTQTISVVARIVAGVTAAAFFGVLGLSVASAAITVLTFVALWAQARRSLGIWTHVTVRPAWGVLRHTQG